MCITDLCWKPRTSRVNKACGNLGDFRCKSKKNKHLLCSERREKYLEVETFYVEKLQTVM